ncbi:MAG: hypothetical protein EA404_13380 [Spirochaetaceae bacterium]|nr:MAG: hypothetical protein EA404_13380 [Spirochaetaceae bacterium]
MTRFRVSADTAWLAILVLTVVLLLFVVQLFSVPEAARSRRRTVDRAVADLAADRTVGPATLLDPGTAAAGAALIAYYELDNGQAYVIHLTVEGHRSPMQLLLGLQRNGNIFALQMIESGELLWAIARAPRFLDPFIGSGAERPIPRSVSQLDSDSYAAVSGASMTFAAIADALLQASRFVEELP